MRNFHEGEALMQTETGIDTARFDQAVNDSFVPDLSPNEVQFVQGLTFSVATSIGSDGRPWTSPMFGGRGVLFEVESPTVVRIAVSPTDGDPLVSNVVATGELGVLYFDPSRRRRAKSIGTATVERDGRIRYEMTRNFGLCTKYIFKRSHLHVEEAGEVQPHTSETHLSELDQRQLVQADTIFFGSFYKGRGADATHRGGAAGFIDVVDEVTVRVPDYPGNGMFNTLGNLQINPRFSMLHVDFTTGRTIQTTGVASVERTPDDPRAARWVNVTVESVIVTWSNVGTWMDIEPSSRLPAQ